MERDGDLSHAPRSFSSVLYFPRCIYRRLVHSFVALPRSFPPQSRALSNSRVCAGQLLPVKGLFVVMVVVVLMEAGAAVTPLFADAANQSPERPRHTRPSAGSRPRAKQRAGSRKPTADCLPACVAARLPGWMTGYVTGRPADSLQGRLIGRLPS